MLLIKRQTRQQKENQNHFPSASRVSKVILFSGVRRSCPWILLLAVQCDITMPNNFSAALHLFESVEGRCLRDPVFVAQYEKAISEYENLGFARQVSVEELSQEHPRRWYLPHHGVRSPSKPGRVRVVFNGTFQFKGVSRNQCLLTGPNLMTGLTECLIRSTSGWYEWEQ